MGDTSDSVSGSLVKKNLFSASSSGANDAFRPAYVGHLSPGGLSPALRLAPQRNGNLKPTLAAAAAAAAAAPPRFFSTTHPSADAHTQQSLKTPSRVPNSPPSLQRKPVTRSSQLAVVAADNRPVEFCPAVAMTNFKDISEEDTDTLSFLKDLAAKQKQDSSLAEEARTEVHDNTTKRHIQQTMAASQPQTPIASEGDQSNLDQCNTESPKLDAETAKEEQVEGGDAAATGGSGGREPFPFLKNGDGEEQEPDDDSIPGIQSYPSYYDNPYVNPYASAVKPNDLFRNKDQDTSIDSDINSNCSEFGTVIGAPSLMADRFAEVDAMEREGTLAMYNDESIFEEGDEDTFDDPDLANYKSFRVSNTNHDKDEQSTDNEEDSAQFHTPSVVSKKNLSEQKNDGAPTTSSEVLSAASQMGTGVGVNQARERIVDIEAMAAKMAAYNHNDEEDSQFECESSHGSLTATAKLQEAPSPQTLPAGLFPSSLPIREADIYETALSVVDSDIGQLIRQSASEHSGNGAIKRFNSNNSAEVFRAPSVGSLADKIPQHQQSKNCLSPIANIPDDNEDGELETINGDRSRDSFTLSAIEQRKIRPSSSLQRALTLSQKQMEDNESQCKLSDYGLQQKEDEKEEKEGKFKEQQDRQDQAQQQQYHFQVVPAEGKPISNCEKDTAVDSSHLASAGSPGIGLANTIQLFGTKLPKRPPPTTSSFSLDQFFFDIEDNEQETRNNGTESTRDLSWLLKGDHEPNQEQSKRQESSHQSPTRGEIEGSLTQQADNPSTRLLKSPGTPTRLMADFRRESSYTGNDGTGNNDGQSALGWLPSILNSGSFAVLSNAALASAGGCNQKAQPQPLRHVLGCMSFDATVDRRYGELQYAHDAAAKENQFIKSSQSCDSPHPANALPSRASLSAFRHLLNGEEKIKGGEQALYPSQSWDIGSSIWSATAGASGVPGETENKEATLDTSASRFAPCVRHQGHQHDPHPHRYNGPNRNRLVTSGRHNELVLMSDTSQATRPSRQHSENLELLQTPQRIEIEREDALNLLACLCERGVDLNDPAGQPEVKCILNEKATPKDQNSKKLKLNGANGTKQNWVNSSHQLEPETVNETVNILRELSRDRYRCDGDSTETSSPKYHLVRMQVLDELMSSHTYALEMKRAARSASAWLRSIGHTDNLREEDASKTQATAEQAGGKSKQSNCGSLNGTADHALVLSLKALLHQAQLEIQEKDQALSKCRAEIGRLKSASQNKTSFTSPKCSILDDDSASENDPVDIVASGDRDGRIADGSMVDLEASLFANDENAGEVVRGSDQPLARELKICKSALHDANAIIRKLHGELQDAKPDGEVLVRGAPQIEVSQKTFSAALADESTSNIEKTSNGFPDNHAENGTVNVQMLDGENFLTEWQMAESLPPPPDHGLRSPIVNELLSQWSTDETLHASLLAWMDNAMIADADPNSVPPLTLSSLDHQVRDGFMMHVLPLLLRRSNVLVDVKTRAHRKTTYDVAVSIKSNTCIAGPSGRHFESVSSRQNYVFSSRPDSLSGFGSITHSTITANSDCTKNVCDVGSTVASYATCGNGHTTLVPQMPSDEKCDSPQPQAGLMSALGGALGGFLTRRKQSLSFYDAGLEGSYDMGSAVGAAGPGPMDFPHEGSPQISAGTGDQEPYHRLVSAPPGRIGVSFVEYRGHAMVSDVSNGSPLLGWIFPSDILIAIDEVPVSGMKLKDIVKVLQARSERQRAMRVISSHAMQEFAANPNTTPS